MGRISAGTAQVVAIVVAMAAGVGLAVTGDGAGTGFAGAPRSTPSILHWPSNVTPFPIMRDGVSRLPFTRAGCWR